MIPRQGATQNHRAKNGALRRGLGGIASSRSERGNLLVFKQEIASSAAGFLAMTPDFGSLCLPVSKSPSHK